MNWDNENKRFVFTSLERSLPVYIESIGYSAWELIFTRPEGYPYFHWLQTVRGEGVFIHSGERIAMTPGKGVLLTPFTPHSYFPASDQWSTVYITFGGAAVDPILDSLDMNMSAVYTDTQLSISDLIGLMLQKVDVDSEFSRLESSKELYHFLIMLKKFGMRNDRPSLSQTFDKVRPVVQWLKRNYSNNIGLSEMAEHAGMSVSYLSELFQQAFGMSPYSFLIQLRIRESKHIMITNPNLPLKEVAARTGFNDVSHFVATFRKKEGVTPAKYRNLYLSSEGETS
ncbi:AraC family transcriptional regulator [Cohnella mopanensis]|uniref:AraC family transcriptional regulator n=1 Tax=Cohnella mopanensis TaxID=2911966 RepID=UPI001EF8FD50|nr:AraC family transcriptional regulator [Cohnella mopanensis]